MSNRRWAVLIDCQNVSHEYARFIFGEAGKLGHLAVVRGYFCGSVSNVVSWNQALIDTGVAGRIVIGFPSAKNGADFMLTMDAIDLLHGNSLYGFCIVSSDGDFARLVDRLTEVGKAVCIFGKSNGAVTPGNGHAQFVRLPDMTKGTVVQDAKPSRQKVKTKVLEDYLNEAIKKMQADDSGWYHLSLLPARLKEIPDFDMKVFGNAKYATLVGKAAGFELGDNNRKFRKLTTGSGAAQK